MKLLPQFSIRLMLGVTALAAGLFSIVGLAAGAWLGDRCLDGAGVARDHAGHRGRPVRCFVGVFAGISPPGGAADRCDCRRAAGGLPRCAVRARSPFADRPIDAIVIEADAAAAPPGATAEVDPTTGDSP